MQKRFEGKTAVITGASGGIGAAIARRFADEGRGVVVSAVDPRVEEIADRAARRRRARPRPRSMDVTNEGRSRGTLRFRREGVRPRRHLDPERRRDHHRQDRGDDRSRVGQGHGGQHQGRVPVLPGGDRPHPQAREGGPPDQHRLRPGAAGLHLHPALRRQQVRRGRHHPKPRQGSGQGEASRSMRSAPASSTPTCGPTTTQPGASCSATTSPAS